MSDARADDNIEDLFAPKPKQAEPPPKQRRAHRRTRPAGGEQESKPPKETKPAPAGRREPLRQMGTGIAKGLAFLASNAEMTGASRALMLQSEAWGPAFDQAVKGTVIDRILQPLAKTGGNTKDLAALVGLPIATEAYLRDPTPMTQGAFSAALIASLPQIAAARKTAAKEQAKLEADLAELAEMFGKDPGEHVSLNEVAMWLMTGSTDGTVAPPPPPPAPPAPPPYDDTQQL